MKHKTILGIEPGTRQMGLALLRGREPRYFGVRTLRNGSRPHDVIAQAKRIVLEAVEEHQPQVVAIEQPFNLATKRSNLLNAIADELRARASELGLKVVPLAPEEIRRRVTGNPLATRLEVAEHVARSRFDRISTLIATRAARAELRLRPHDEYWLPAFGALALALAARDAPMGYLLSRGVSLLEWAVPPEEEGMEFELALFDAAGRQMTSIARGVAHAGRFEREVSFRADGGDALRSGVYFVRLRVGKRELSRMVFLGR